MAAVKCIRTWCKSDPLQHFTRLMTCDGDLLPSDMQILQSNV